MKSRVAPVLALLLGGCASMVNESPTQPPAAPAGWRNAAAVTPLAPATPWWQAYGDPQLDALVAAALAANADIAIAVERVAIARGHAGVADASGMPTMRAGADVQRTRVPRQRVSDLDEAGQLIFWDIPGYEENRRNVGVALSYELDLFGRVARARAAGQASLTAAEQDAAALRLLIAREVVLAYTDLRLAQARLALLQQQQGLAGRMQHDAVARKRLGLVDRQAETSALNQGGRVQLGMLAERRQAAQAQARLAMLLGQDAASLPLADGPLPQAALQVAPDLPAAVLGRRPDLLAAWQQVEVQRIGIEQARLLRYPRIALTGSAGFASNALGSFLDHDYLTWALGAGVDWLLFDGGRTEAEVATARAEHALAIAHYRKTMLNALREVEEALAEWQQAQQALPLLTAGEARAQRLLDDAGANQRLGRADRAARQEAELAWLEARLDEVEGQAARLRSFAQLNAALGW